MTRYAAFEVYELNNDGTKTPIADAEVNVYDAADNSLLDTLTADANGVVWPFELDVPAGTAIYYEYDDGSDTYRGGQGVTSEFLYQDIVVSDDPTQSFYPTGNVEPVAVEVYVRESANVNAAWRLHARYAPTAIASIPVALAQDRAIDVRVVSFAPDGTRNVSEISHAPGQAVDYQRQLPTDTGVLTPAGYVDPLTVQLAVSGFSPFAVAREIQQATNNTFTTGVLSEVFEGSDARSAVYFATRASSPGQPAETRFYRCRHSTTGPDGPWSNWSDATEVYFPEEPV